MCNSCGLYSDGLTFILIVIKFVILVVCWLTWIFIDFTPIFGLQVTRPDSPFSPIVTRIDL